MPPKTDAEYAAAIAVAQAEADDAAARLGKLREDREAARLAQLPPNPFKVGDLVHTSRQAALRRAPGKVVLRVNPRSVVVAAGWGNREETVPVGRVTLAPQRVGRGAH